MGSKFTLKNAQDQEFSIIHNDNAGAISVNSDEILTRVNLSGLTAYHLLQGDLSVSNTLLTNGFSTALYTSGSATTGTDMSTQWGNDTSETFGGLVWLKDRVEATNNFLYDTIRGATKEINSNTTDAEATLAGGLTAFTSTGFTVGADAGHNSTANNMVSWNFQTTHRRTGTTNQGKAYTEHYNPFTGFTIIKYEGSGLAGHEIPHSLGRKLGFSVIKALTQSDETWVVKTLHMSDNSNYLRLNETTAIQTSTAVAREDYYNKVILQGTGADLGATNQSGNIYILYGWANSYFDESNKLIGNYEIGTYQGTGVAGNKVTTKGKPAWVMIKPLSEVSSWYIFDNQRGSDFDNILYPNLSNAEATSEHIDVNIDGFTLTSTSINTSGGQYLYMIVYDNDSGSGKSKYHKATDASNLNINNAIIPFAQGIDGKGTKALTISKNESITGLTYSAGKNYVYSKLDGTYGVTKYRPRYLKSDLVAEVAGDNPDYFDVLSNTWFSTLANPELVTNGTFDVNTTGWTAVASTLSIVNNTIRVTSNSALYGQANLEIATVIGKKYKATFKINAKSNTQAGVYIDSLSGTISNGILVNTGISASVGYYTLEFVAQTTTTYIKLASENVSGYWAQFDNISVYATDLAVNTEIPSRTYLDSIAYADASGQLTYIEALPKTQYFDRIETGNNRKVMYLSDYGISAIQVNKRYVLDNPFGNDRFMDCDTKLEIYDSGNGKWIEVGHSTSGTGTDTYWAGVKSFSTVNGIVVQTALSYLTTGVASTLIISETASGALTSAPARVTIQFNGKTGRTR